jgi:signal transduction histidine kinase
VGDLLDANRLESGALQLNRSRFDLVALLQEVRTRMEPADDRHSIRVAAPASLLIEGDRDRLEQVLVNLVSNAIRYSPEGGPVEIKARQAGDAIEISVADRGLGVPKEHQPAIFERFGRAHGPAFGGLGLGLAISKGIVGQHGGTIRVESAGTPGAGSTFHVRLPALGH